VALARSVSTGKRESGSRLERLNWSRGRHDAGGGSRLAVGAGKVVEGGKAERGQDTWLGARDNGRGRRLAGLVVGTRRAHVCWRGPVVMECGSRRVMEGHVREGFG
jgi:hypothetical protein